MVMARASVFGVYGARCDLDRKDVFRLPASARRAAAGRPARSLDGIRRHAALPSGQGTSARDRRNRTEVKLMRHKSIGFAAATLLSALAIGPARAQEPARWQDPSKHKVYFVTVEEGVQLEVLDWGGPGRPVVLLAGSGNKAHVYDDFAPKLSDCCHVYAITRRGFGYS